MKKLSFKKNADRDFDQAYEANLMYILNPEKNVDVIKRQFVKSRTRDYLTVGKIDCPTGKIVVADPLACLPSKRYFSPLDIQVRIGEYPVEISICIGNGIGPRICTARLKLKDTAAVSYNLANFVQKRTEFFKRTGILSGFAVDEGMLSFCDEQVAIEYESFVTNWRKNNPCEDYYDDYFAKFLEKSYKKLPQYQRVDGDFIEWQIPKTKNRMVMLASGLGDGFYRCYWGYDSNNEICELIVPLINPDIFGL